jgi:hypothetical protein
MDTERRDVESFLNEFKVKMKVFGIVYMRDREKNLQTQLDLELREFEKDKYVCELTVEDFYKGPTQDYNGGDDFWEFGKMIKKKEVYIKITMGIGNKPVICISFHFPERPIKYPFK